METIYNKNCYPIQSGVKEVIDTGDGKVWAVRSDGTSKLIDKADIGSTDAPVRTEKNNNK